MDRTTWDHWKGMLSCESGLRSVLFIQNKDEIFIPECCSYSFFFASYISCTQILITNQMDSGCKLFPTTWERKNNANGWKEFSLGAGRLCSCSMQMHWAWSRPKPTSTQYRKAHALCIVQHAAQCRGLIFVVETNRGAWQKPLKAHMHAHFVEETYAVHALKVDQQFILTGTHSEAAPHTKRNSMMQNGLASWSEWTATAWGRKNDRKESLPFIWERRSHFFCGAAGTCQGQSPHVSVSNWSASLCPVPITLW